MTEYVIKKTFNSLSTKQQLAMMYLISKVKGCSKPKNKIAVPLKALYKIYGIENNVGRYHLIKNELLELDRIEAIENEKGVKVRFAWFDVLRLDRKNGLFIYTFNSSLQNFIYGVKANG